MKFLMPFGLIIVSALSTFAQEATSPVGRWKTIDDETKAVKSIVEIREVDGALEGTVLQLFRKPEEDQNPKCDQCQGEQKDQPIIGLKILKGMKKSDDVWSGGEILDPKKGKTYSCKMEMIENGKKLKVRGFIGFSLLGRTQVWEREIEAPAEVKASTVKPAAEEAATEAPKNADDGNTQPASPKASAKKKAEKKKN